MPFEGSCLCLLDVTRAASFWQWTNYFELPHSGIGRFSCEGIATMHCNVSPISRRKSKHCSVNSFQRPSLQIDSCQENLYVLINDTSSTIKGTQRFEPYWELSKTPLYCCIIVIKTTTITISSFCLSCPAPALLGVNLSLAKLASSSISSKPISHSWLSAECQKPQLIFDRFWIISPSVLSSKTTNACIFTITHWQSR